MCHCNCLRFALCLFGFCPIIHSLRHKTFKSTWSISFSVFGEVIFKIIIHPNKFEQTLGLLIFCIRICPKEKWWYRFWSQDSVQSFKISSLNHGHSRVQHSSIHRTVLPLGRQVLQWFWFFGLRSSKTLYVEWVLSWQHPLFWAIWPQEKKLKVLQPKAFLKKANGHLNL